MCEIAIARFPNVLTAVADPHRVTAVPRRPSSRASDRLRIHHDTAAVEHGLHDAFHGHPSAARQLLQQARIPKRMYQVQSVKCLVRKLVSTA